MKKFGMYSIVALMFLTFVSNHLAAQGFGETLGFQGIDHFSTSSAASRSFGGISFGGTQSDIGLMFSNPASLKNSTVPQISIGGGKYYSDLRQTQQYSPLKYYSNLSLLMEGLTGYISNPTTYDTTTTYQAKDTVQRPFDNIGPNWNAEQPHSAPFQIFAAVPVTIGDYIISVGAGMAEYSDLTWKFKNNNVLTPSILSVNPTTITIPSNNLDTNSIPVQWYQYAQQRTGSIQSYGGAIALTVGENLSVGVNAMVLKGSSDDQETHVERGRIRLYQTFFRAESVYFRSSRTGTSQYDGNEFTFSAFYQNKFIGFGVSIKSPTIITRTYSSVLRSDTTGNSISTTIKGKDQLTIPLRGSAALTLALRENLTMGLQYDFRPFSSAEYKHNNGTVTKPWLSANILHLGLEYRPLPELVLHAGVREQAEVFQPVGNPLPGEAANSSVYSIGAGTAFFNLRLNVVYEYSKLKYIDMWASAVSINSITAKTINADLAYEIPW